MNGQGEQVTIENFYQKSTYDTYFQTLIEKTQSGAQNDCSLSVSKRKSSAVLDNIKLIQRNMEGFSEMENLFGEVSANSVLLSGNCPNVHKGFKQQTPLKNHSSPLDPRYARQFQYSRQQGRSIEVKLQKLRLSRACCCTVKLLTVHSRLASRHTRKSHTPNFRSISECQELMRSEGRLTTENTR